MSAITSITAQNTYQVTKIIDIEPDMIVEQIRVCVEDIGVDAIKTGMLHKKEIIEAVSDEISSLKKPIVVDPVMIAKSGARLLEEDSIEALKRKLLPIATVITPNAREAEVLTGITVKDLASQRKAAKKLADLGARAVVVKGGHIANNVVTDVLYVDDEYFEFSSDKLSDKTTHGTGCVFASAITAELAKSSPIKNAVLVAKKFVSDAIRYGLELGRGVGPVNPTWSVYRNSSLLIVMINLKKVIEELEKLEGAGKLSPESMINIGEAIPNAQSRLDIVAIPGRITKIGDRLKATSCPCPGGSRHIANAILELMSIDPRIRAAMNIIYSEELINLAKKLGMKVSSYDRSEEPEDIKKKEGMTIRWGIRKAYESAGEITDIIYHRGDWGKEPMILITGRDSIEVVEKFKKLLKEYLRIIEI